MSTSHDASIGRIGWIDLTVPDAERVKTSSPAPKASAARADTV